MRKSDQRNKNGNQRPPKKKDDRLLFLLANLVVRVILNQGTTVEVTVRNGNVYSGIFHTANAQDSLGVCLKMAQRLVDTKPAGQIYKTLVILGKDVVGVSAVKIDLLLNRENQGFKTDTAISNSGDLKTRQLEKWEPDEGSKEETLDTSSSGNWDQFAVNEKLFGVTTDFEESLYTTVLDKSGPDFKKREAEAIRVAAEIQKSATSNTHLAEERGQVVDSTGQDEEERYSSVIRNPPPILRKASSTRSGTSAAPVKSTSPLDSKKSNQSSSNLKFDASSSGSWADEVDEVAVAPPVKTAWSRERPFKPSTASATSNQKKGASVSIVEKTVPSVNGGDSKNITVPNKQQQSGSKKPLEYAQVANRRSATEKKSEPLNQTSSAPTSTKSSSATTPTSSTATQEKGAVKSTKALIGILDRDGSAVKIEKATGSPGQAAEPVAKAFSKFVSKEKEARKLERKKEIGSVINDLKSFSETFKLKTPVPSDLQELFSKNKNSASNSSLVLETGKKSQSATKAPKSPSNSSFKFNAKASEFKPNPNAAAFVPSMNVVQPQPEKNAFFGNKVLDKTPLSIKKVFSEGFHSQSHPKPSQIPTTWQGNPNISYRMIPNPQISHHNMGMSYEEVHGYEGYPAPVAIPYGYMPYAYPPQRPPRGYAPYGQPGPVPYAPYAAPIMHQGGAPIYAPPMWTGAPKSDDGSNS